MLNISEKTWNEFWAYHWRVTELHAIPGISEWDKKLVNFIEQTLEMKPGMEILDLGCGGGDQAKVFAQKGYRVTGVDIAPSLVEYARNQFRENGLEGEFLVGDMREINYESRFDTALILSGSFGFFGDEADQDILRRMTRALKPGGKVFIMYKSANAPDKHVRSWKENEDGWQFFEHWFDMETSTYYSNIFIIRKDGTLIQPALEKGYHAHESIRCYTVPEMKAMFRRAGLEYLAGYSDQKLSLPPETLSPGDVRCIATGKKPEHGII